MTLLDLWVTDPSEKPEDSYQEDDGSYTLQTLAACWLAANFVSEEEEGPTSAELDAITEEADSYIAELLAEDADSYIAELLAEDASRLLEE